MDWTGISIYFGLAVAVVGFLGMLAATCVNFYRNYQAGRTSFYDMKPWLGGLKQQMWRFFWVAMFGLVLIGAGIAGVEA